MGALTLPRTNLFIVTALTLTVAYIITIKTGWTVITAMTWLCGLMLVAAHRGVSAYYINVVAIMVFILAITPVQTGTELLPAVLMFTGMVGAVIAPFFIQRFICADLDLVRLKIPMRRLSRSEWWYVVAGLAVVIPWLIIYFATSSVEQYWNIRTSVDAWITFGAIMVIGAWEEVFFIAAIMGILQRRMSFWWANAIQGVLFTAFLWQVGFREWGTIFLITYCLYQGYVYMKTKNLWVTLLIHAVVDLAVFVLLLNKTLGV